jgi:hypothetical protein
MGIQVVVEVADMSEVENALAPIISECEVFTTETGRIGISIPTKVVDGVGEEMVRLALSRLQHFDLWEGKWHPPGGP